MFVIRCYKLYDDGFFSNMPFSPRLANLLSYANLQSTVACIIEKRQKQQMFKAWFDFIACQCHTLKIADLQAHSAVWIQHIVGL